MQTRRSALPALLAFALTTIACSGGDGGSTGPPVPEAMQKTSGDNQTGAPGATLAQPLEVKVTDGSGRPVSGFTVSFSASGGTLSPQSEDTDNNGRARTTLRLPAQEGTVTVTATGAGVPQQQFTAQAVAPAVQIATTQLVAARSTLPYAASLVATGGSGGQYSFSVTGGSLPPGLTLGPDGKFQGTPTATGSFGFTVRATDGIKEATRTLSLQVCEVPSAMSVGEVRLATPSSFGSCGIFLPAGAGGDRYRVGVIRTSNQADPSDLQTVTLRVTGNGVSATAAPPRTSSFLAGRPLDLNAGELARAARLLQSTASAHARAQREDEALVRRLGADRVLRDRPAPARISAPAPLPPKLRLDVGRSSTCQPGARATAILIAEDDRLGIYQDSTQNAAASTRITPAMANIMLAYYRNHGQEVIEDYFGAPGDIDGNEKVIVFVTPSIGANTLGLVWSGNFYSQADCPASNAGEYIYLNHLPIVDLTDPDVDFTLALHALVHEIKHVASMYQRILRAGAGQAQFHPVWEEEGGGEIAAERAARLAWAQSGGPEVNETVVRDHLIAETTEITSENIAMLFMLLRTQETLSAQPNSIVIGPPGGPSDYIYGSGWLFLRFLGDAFGNAGAVSGGDAGFFTQLHDRGTVSGVSGITAVTGRNWDQLMEDYLTASMVNGQPNVAVPLAFTSYDFVSAIETYCFALDPRFVDDPRNTCTDDDGDPLPPGAPGAFPWPVTTDDDGNILTRGLVTATYAGSAAPSGMRVHDFTSNGTGVGAEINVELSGGSRIVVIRLN